MKAILLGYACLLGGLVPALAAEAQTLNSFSNGTAADAEKVNENFEALKARISALEKRLDQTSVLANMPGSTCNAGDYVVGISSDGAV